jgi:alkylation response protein AidB-like acyl-CoA dehydrogenase
MCYTIDHLVCVCQKRDQAMAGKSEAVKVTPAGRTKDQWRQIFFDEIDANAAIFEKDAIEGDSLRRLPPATLEVLRNSDLRLLKYPSDLGGAEADNALQFEVFERLAYHNASASWCLFIYADLIARIAAYLPQRGFSKVFDAGIPLICGGGGMILGNLTPAAGGYRVSGRWVYGSGIAGSNWVVLLAAQKDRPGPPEILSCVVPTAQVQVHDNWNVLGMRASGSSDFSTENVFVPEELTFRFNDPPFRGGAIFRLGMMGYVGHTVPATALGIARRALDEATTIAKQKLRGYGKRTPLAHRGVFQAFLGESDLKLRAARAMMLENGVRIVADAARMGTMKPENEAEIRAAGCYATRIAVEIVDGAVRYIGGDAIRQGSRLEQALRDVHVANTHFFVSDSSIESHAQFLLGIDGADPMA